MGARLRVGTRFGGFALGHLCVSLLCAGVCFLVGLLVLQAGPEEALAGLSVGKLWLAGVGMMLLYLPAGYLTARHRRWPRPGLGEGALAVVLPTLVAWAWAALALLFLIGFFGRDAAIGAMGLILFACVFATPSVCFLFCALMTLFTLSITTLPVDALFLAATALAGLFPPLLFCLGSLVGAQKPVDNLE